MQSVAVSLWGVSLHKSSLVHFERKKWRRRGTTSEKLQMWLSWPVSTPWGWSEWLWRRRARHECTRKIAGNLRSIWSWSGTYWSSSRSRSLRGTRRRASPLSSSRKLWEGHTFWSIAAKTGAICICLQWDGTLCISSGRLRMKLIDTWSLCLWLLWWTMLESGYWIFFLFFVLWFCFSCYCSWVWVARNLWSSLHLDLLVRFSFFRWLCAIHCSSKVLSGASWSLNSWILLYFIVGCLIYSIGRLSNVEVIKIAYFE